MSIYTREIEKILDYKFNNLELLKQAFTRRSYSAENGGSDNEVLEFIGDRVLDLAVTMILIDHYGISSASGSFDFEDNFSKTLEGLFTELKADLVQKKSLSNVIDSLGLQKYLIMGNGDIKQNVKEKDSVKEDLFEAIIGAVALDCKFNMQTIVSVVKKMIDFDSYLRNVRLDFINYVGILQEWAQKHHFEIPEYSYIICDTQIPGVCHDAPIITCRVTIPEIDSSLNYAEVNGVGLSKKTLRRTAAQRMCEQLGIFPYTEN